MLCCLALAFHVAAPRAGHAGVLVEICVDGGVQTLFIPSQTAPEGDGVCPDMDACSLCTSLGLVDAAHAKAGAVDARLWPLAAPMEEAMPPIRGRYQIPVSRGPPGRTPVAIIPPAIIRAGSTTIEGSA